jgi:hypothetical protein
MNLDDFLTRQRRVLTLKHRKACVCGLAQTLGTRELDGMNRAACLLERLAVETWECLDLLLGKEMASGMI